MLSRPSPGGTAMATAKNDDLLTAGAIAKAIGASDAKVKNAIKTLGLKPKAKKGVCAYYGADSVAKVKKALG
jgi:tetrahydromethanopterin S-methyltransferase subunit C